MMTDYLTKRDSRSEFVNLRGLRYHVRHWGREEAPVIWMLHGWMDVSASFQFVVDELSQDWHVIAPDWRGFGLSARSGADTYWFPDYLGDLDALVGHYCQEETIRLVGHSMGANVASLYAGVRPEKVNAFVNLEGFGLPLTHPKQAPKRMLNWLEQLKEPASLKDYENLEAVASRLMKNNSRLSADKAAFLAHHWSEKTINHRFVLQADPAHKQHGPLLYQVDEMLACWQKTMAPVLWVEAEHTNIWSWMGDPAQAAPEIERRLNHYQNLTKKYMLDAGHMMHHDQPALLAKWIEDFFNQHSKHA